MMESGGAWGASLLLERLDAKARTCGFRAMTTEAGA